MYWIKWTRLWHKGYPNGYTVCGIRIAGIALGDISKTRPDDLGIVCSKCRRADNKAKTPK